MKPSSRSAAAALLVLFAPAAVAAGSIYLNGVNIDGVVNTKFEKATVRIDEKGNVFIDAPGYQAKVVEGGPTPKTAAGGSSQDGEPTDTEPGRLTKRYWLVTEQSAVGMTEFDIDLYVNSKWVRKLKNTDESIVTEITRHLVPGRNNVLLIARKVATGARKSFSPQHYFKVIIGEGNVGGDNVMIDNPVVQFSRNASEAQDVSEEFNFTTR